MGGGEAGSGQHGSADSKRESEDGVLPLNHVEGYAEVAEDGHGNNVSVLSLSSRSKPCVIMGISRYWWFRFRHLTSPAGWGIMGASFCSFFLAGNGYMDWRESMSKFIRRIWWEDDGQDIAEYAVMLAVILVLVVGTIRLIGSNANNAFSNVASSIQ